MADSAIDLPIEQLSVDERLSLLGRLWDSLLDEGPLPIPAWHLAEVGRRIAILDADPSAFVTPEELRRELKAEGADFSGERGTKVLRE